MESSTHTNNVVVGAGEFYVDLEATGEARGERYLGDSAGGTLAVTTERVTVFSGDGPVARKLVDSVRSIERTLTLTLRDISMENLALFVGAEANEAVSDAATAVVDEAVTVRKGRWYQLGVSDDKPTGIGAVASRGVAVARQSGTAQTYQQDRDYVLDAARGRIFIVEGGSIADGATIHVDYTPVAGTRRQVRTGALRDIRGAVRYLETPTVGQGRSYYAPLCSIAPAGEITLKSRDSEQQMQLTVSVLEPEDGTAALYIDGEVADGQA